MLDVRLTTLNNNDVNDEEFTERKISIQRLKDFSSLNDEIIFDLYSPYKFSNSKKILNEFNIEVFLIKVDGETFGHTICFYKPEENVLRFGFFGNYGQFLPFTKALIEEIINFAKELGRKIIIGPYNFPLNFYGLGFSSEMDYIDTFKKFGFHNEETLDPIYFTKSILMLKKI